MQAEGRGLRRGATGVLLLAAAAAGLWLVQTRQSSLSRGRTESGVLQPGSAQNWMVVVERDKHAAIVVRSKDAAVSARLIDPSGEVRRTLTTDDSGLLMLRWLADREGRWQIEIDADPAAGSDPFEYSIQLTAVRTPTARDRLEWDAETADEEVWQALTGNNEDGDRALELLPRAVAAREKLLRGDPRRLARYLNDLATDLAGGCSATPERWRSADSLLVRAVRLWESSKTTPPLEIAETLSNLAVIASYQGRWDRAERFQRRVLELDGKHRRRDDVEFGYDIMGLASIRFEQGYYSEVEPLLSQALEIFQAAEPRDAFLVAEAYNRLGELRRALGSYGDAEESFEQAYREARKSLPEGDLFFADLDNNLAGLYRDLGEHHKSELLLQRALQACKDSTDCCPRRLATAQLNLAEVIRVQGDFERSRPLYASAVALATSAMAEDDPELAWSLNQQGLFFAEQQDYEQAILYYEEAMAVTERAFGRRHPVVAISLQDLARLHLDAGRPGKAEALYLQALAIRWERFGERHPETAETLTRLGELYAHAGRTREANEHLDRAIEILSETEAFPEIEADAWAARAKVAKSLGNLPAALSDLKRSLGIIERLRPLIGGGESTRSRFLSRHQDFYEHMIEWQIEAGNLERAFAYAEGIRARVLVDQLFANQVDLRSGMPPEVRLSLEKRKSDVLARHAELKKRIDRLERGSAEPHLLADLQRKWDEARAHLEEVEEQFRNASPLWKATAGGELARLSEVQDDLIPPRSLLLLYQIGPESGHLFLLPPAPAPASALPLSVPPALAPALGVSPGPLNRERLLHILHGPSGRHGLLKRLGSRPAPGTARGPALFSALHALTQVLLPGETWARVRASSLALVIPEGVLHGFPFEALAVTAGGQDSTRYWLDEGPVIRYAASATALRKLTERSRLRTPGSGRHPMLLSVAAPRFAAPREAMRKEPGVPAAALPPFRGSLAPLPGTLKEAERILAAFGSMGGALLLKDVEANENRVRAALKGTRYLHFATHGIVDERRSGMFAGLALSPPTEVVDSSNDGFLQLFEIYGLDLSCDLAVLSACQTRTGPEVEGEGVFALSRGFLVAGADRVVASLWRVDDEATAELIGDFFQQVVSAGRSGRRPAFAEALRQARRKIRNQSRWRDPYYWAPFVLDGKG